MIFTESMMKKIQEPGLWFLKSSRPMTDISELIYEFAVLCGLPVFVQTRYKCNIQQDVVEKVMKDCIEKASDENEKNWLEKEMEEYNAHGFFFHPQEMDDYVENGPFWSEYVTFDEYEDCWLGLHNLFNHAIIVEDISYLEYDDEKDLLRILQLNYEDAIRLKNTVIVLVQGGTFGTATEFIENHLFE